MSTTIKRQAFAQTIESVAAVGGTKPQADILIQTTTTTEVEWGASGETTEDVQTDGIGVEQLADDDAFLAALDASGWQIVNGSLDHSHGSVSADIEPKG